MCVCVCVRERVCVCVLDVSLSLFQSYIAAESEHLLAHTATLQLPTETELQICDQAFFLQSADHLPSLLWFSLCLKALDSSLPCEARFRPNSNSLSLSLSVFRWLPDVFRGLRADLPGNQIQSSSSSSLSLLDIEVIGERREPT